MNELLGGSSGKSTLTVDDAADEETDSAGDECRPGEQVDPHRTRHLLWAGGAWGVVHGPHEQVGFEVA